MKTMNVTQIKNIKQIYDVMCLFKEDIFDKSINLEIISRLAKKFQKNAIFLAVFKGAQCMGYISFYCNDKIKRTSYISMIIIGMKFQHCGIGRMLINEVINYSKDNGMIFLELKVSVDNINAIEFYLNNGFKEVSRLRNTILMRKCID